MPNKPKIKSKDIMDNYRSELDDYNRWLIVKQNQYGKNFMCPMECWDEFDYQQVIRLNTGIRTTERVLGLTEKEVEKEYRDSCKRTGYKPTRKKKST